MPIATGVAGESSSARPPDARSAAAPVARSPASDPTPDTAAPRAHAARRGTSWSLPLQTFLPPGVQDQTWSGSLRKIGGSTPFRDASNRAVGSIATWMATAAVGEPGRVMATDLDPCFAPDDPRIQVRCHDIAAGSSRQGRHLARCGARRGVGRAGGIADREFPGREPILPHAGRRGQTTATARWPE